MMRVGFCMLLVSGRLLTACGHDDGFSKGSTTQRIIGGEIDTDPQHDAVVAIDIGEGYFCTGTYICPRVILTAAHCVDPDQPEYTVFFGTDVGNPASYQTRTSVERKIHPNYPPHPWGPQPDDIAMLRLSQDAPPGVVPIPFLPHAVGVTQTDIGAQLEFIGFGDTDPINTGVNTQRRRTIQTLDLVCVNPDGCTNPWWDGLDFFNNNICQDEQPGGTCSGDSGGPALLVRSGRTFVAGVDSFGDGMCQLFNCHTKVDEYEDFIREYCPLAAQGDSCPGGNASCQSGYCVDEVCCESACAEECAACNNPSQPGRCLPEPDGASCGESDACLGARVCASGRCSEPQPLQCDDLNSCTIDSCDSGRGCVHTALSDGSACEDPSKCPGQASCQQGICTTPESSRCDDQSPCTIDSCDPSAGCLHTPLPDGKLCGDNQVCRDGICAPLQASSGCSCDAVEAGLGPLGLGLIGWLMLLACIRFCRIRTGR